MIIHGAGALFSFHFAAQVLTHGSQLQLTDLAATKATNPFSQVTRKTTRGSACRFAPSLQCSSAGPFSFPNTSKQCTSPRTLIHMVLQQRFRKTTSCFSELIPQEALHWLPNADRFHCFRSCFDSLYAHQYDSNFTKMLLENLSQIESRPTK